MKHVRLLHAGALRLNNTFEALGVSPETGDALRAAQKDVLEKLAQQAQSLPADMIILSGGLFATLPVRADLLLRVLECLEQVAPTPVYIFPGAHEGLHDLSPWDFALVPDNVTVFSGTAWSSVDHPHLPVTIHGRTDAATPLDFRNLHFPEDGRIHIAGIDCGNTSLDELQEVPSRLAYLALGTCQITADLKEKAGVCGCAAAAPQALSFDECGEKHFFKVNITLDDHASIHTTVETLPSSSLLFEKRSLDIADLPSPDENAAQLLALPEQHLKRVLLKLVITGTKNGCMIDHLHSFIKHLRPKLQHLEVEDTSRLNPDSLSAAGTEILTRDIAAQILQRLRDCTDYEEKRRLEMSLRLLFKAVYDTHAGLNAEGLSEP